MNIGLNVDVGGVGSCGHGDGRSSGGSGRGSRVVHVVSRACSWWSLLQLMLRLFRRKMISVVK
jgi:hypothetical protein